MTLFKIEVGYDAYIHIEVDAENETDAENKVIDYDFSETPGDPPEGKDKRILSVEEVVFEGE